MNPQQLMRMLSRMLFRKAFNAGVDHLAGDTPEGRKRAAQGKQIARRARQAQRLTRRIGKF